MGMSNALAEVSGRFAIFRCWWITYVYLADDLNQVLNVGERHIFSGIKFGSSLTHPPIRQINFSANIHATCTYMYGSSQNH